MSSLHREGAPAQAAASPEILASDADRDATAGLLAAAHAEGRLTADEHAERVEAALVARSRAGLARLTADLPGEALAPRAETESDWLALTPISAGIGWCLACLRLACCPAAAFARLIASRRRTAGSGHGAEDR
jgi:hypothetical protein